MSETIYTDLLAAMEERYTQLTGFSADEASDIGIRLKVLAQELADCYDRISSLEAAAFPQTSTGVWLDYHAQTRGLTRKSGVAAQGILRFGRSLPIEGDIQIPEGTICSTSAEPVYRFVTTQTVTLSAGSLWAEAPAVCQTAGQGGNVAAGAVCILITPIAYVESVTNLNPFGGGLDQEDDESLRERLLESYSTVSNGTNAAFYYQQAMKYEGITSACVRPRNRGIGTVDVVVTCAGTEPSPQLLETIQQDLAAQKEINVDVQVLAAQPVSVPVTVAVQPDLDADFEALKESLTQRISAYITSLGVGVPVLLATLGREILGDPQVENYRFTLPAADTAIGEDQVATAGEITITRMEGTV